MRRQALDLCILLVLLAMTVSLASAQPDHVSYQGQLLANGAPFTGTANFKFAIVDGAGSTTLWSNDGNSSGGSEPTAAIPLSVETGIFSVRLGDVATGQIGLTANALAGAAQASLRVWVDTGTGFEQLSDQPLSSDAFALQADAAQRALSDFDVPGTLNVNVVSAGTLVLPNAASDGFVLTSDPNGVASWQPAPSGAAADNDWTILNNDMFAGVGGNVGIGTAAPLEKLHVFGGARFQFASDRWVDASTPGGWPGFIAVTPNSHRRDIIFDNSGMRLLAGDSAEPPGPESGITILENGWVGIGTLSPDEALHVEGNARAMAYHVKNSGWTDAILSGDAVTGGVLELHGPGGPADFRLSMQAIGQNSGATALLYNASTAATVELLGDAGDGGGQIGLGAGGLATLYLDGNNGGGGQLRATNAAGVQTMSFSGQAYSSGSQTRMHDGNGVLAHEWTAANREWKSMNDAGTTLIRTAATSSGGEVFLSQMDAHNGVVLDGDSGGHGLVSVYDDAGVASVLLIGQDSGGDGRIVTDVLEITGGSDLSESFDINGDIEVEPGMVVCIDSSDIGKLVQSQSPYEHTVAGIVSGAGGVKPGMMMGQRGSIADGHHPVALTGRVWTWCDASSMPIVPGDLLTTSSTPGHAMKAVDHNRANGAILGKAMSGLDEGRGLVLVLVSLQ